MGSTSYNDAVYTRRMAYHATTGTSFFVHDSAIKAGTIAAAAHETLDPKKANKAGKVVRESFDSKEHPNSRAVAVLFDVTGSMGTVPGRFKDKLGKLMAALVKKGYLEDPHVLFGAIGDATCDRVPLQIGQFEAGNEMDQALSNVYIESGGGGQQTESYELAMYFMARHTDMDCLNKRGEKGYLFLSGDELPYGGYPERDNCTGVKKNEVARYIGDTLQDDIPLAQILTELRDKFEVFWICPKEGSYYRDEFVMKKLRELFGQNLLALDKAEDVVELIVATIGVSEGFDIHDVAAGLKDIGADGASVDRATKALTPWVKSGAVAKKATAVADGELVPAGTDSVTRL